MTTENPSRRRVVAGTAAALAGASALNAIAIARPMASTVDTPPPAAEPDPVFTAIERHRSAYAVHIRSLADEPDEHDPAKEEWYERSGEAGDAEIAAFEALVKTAALTAGGLLAWLDYVADVPDLGYRAMAFGLIKTVTASARNVIGPEVP